MSLGSSVCLGVLFDGEVLFEPFECFRVRSGGGEVFRGLFDLVELVEGFFEFV